MRLNGRVDRLERASGGDGRCPVCGQDKRHPFSITIPGNGRGDREQTQRCPVCGEWPPVVVS